MKAVSILKTIIFLIDLVHSDLNQNPSKFTASLLQVVFLSLCVMVCLISVKRIAQKQKQNSLSHQ